MAPAARFAAFVAHELRAPLATQRALLELALADPAVDAGAWREIACELLDACRRQERLLDACLVLSRSQEGLGECETVDIAALAGRLLRTTDLDGLRATTSLEPALTIGDPALIERLLDNLLANAIRHNRNGGWIAVTVATTRNRARVAIENPGPRIPDVELPGLFRPFQQLRPRTADPAAAGSGLGLAVVKAVADAHGARIAARARPSGGLRVEVAFSAWAGRASRPRSPQPGGVASPVRYA